MLASVLGYASTVYGLEPSPTDTPHLTALIRLYFIYSLVLTVDAAWLIASAILWPLAHTRKCDFKSASSRRRWRKVSLAINAVMLLLIVVFGPCALAYAAKDIYDDLANGWIEGQAPIFGVLVVLSGITLVANWAWRTEEGDEWDDDKGDEGGDKVAFARA